jgi:peptide/nickel transport system substrate-binding protein
MDRPSHPRRRFILAAPAAAALVRSVPGWAQSAAETSILHVATVGEPGPLDPMAFTADLLSEIDQHIWEGLYIFDPNFHFAPLLASAMPTISHDGKQYVIALRDGVKFHDGSVLSAVDVVASLTRWMNRSPRGRLVQSFTAAIIAPDDRTVRIELKQPYAPLVALLAYPNGAAAIMPRRIAAAADPLKEFVGTGPFKLIEQKPDTYIRLARFDQYASPPGKPDGYAGARKVDVDELRFVPVPNPTTRAQGLLSGEYDFADGITPEGYADLRGKSGVTVGIVKPATSNLLIMNTKAGLTSNVLIRQAIQAALANEDILTAAFGDPSLWALQGSIFPEGTDWFAKNTPGFNQHDPKKAARLLKQAGYNGQKIRILVTQQYDYSYKIGQVVESNLEDAGAVVDLQVMDWATLLQKRQDPAMWDVFVTQHGAIPDPSLFNVVNADYPGWWNTPDKHAAMDAFVAEPDPQNRIQIWQKLQTLFDVEVPAIKIGDAYPLYGIRQRVTGYTPGIWPAFWNTGLKA